MLIRALLFALAPATQAWTPEPTDATDALAVESLSNLLDVSENGTLAKYLATANVSEVCAKDQVKVRKEYSNMSEQEKLDYVGAIKCLMDAPGITPTDAAPGVRSRYDDFVATHVNQTK
ncbi:hypothetical protein Daus18300_001715 [Diaporthe australafricana]|uniref:Uncharacterized protein n=1 Tax=Diaporthe australafricana TaxID=127596 RepID=A0ABR3XV35_9PEZI